MGPMTVTHSGSDHKSGNRYSDSLEGSIASKTRGTPHLGPDDRQQMTKPTADRFGLGEKTRKAHPQKTETSMPGGGYAVGSSTFARRKIEALLKPSGPCISPYRRQSSPLQKEPGAKSAGKAANRQKTIERGGDVDEWEDVVDETNEDEAASSDEQETKTARITKTTAAAGPATIVDTEGCLGHAVWPGVCMSVCQSP